MCGIVGIYLKTKKFEKNLGKMLSGMLNKMKKQFHLQPGKGEKYGYSYKLDRSFKC